MDYLIANKQRNSAVDRIWPFGYFLIGKLKLIRFKIKYYFCTQLLLCGFLINFNNSMIVIKRIKDTFST